MLQAGSHVPRRIPSRGLGDIRLGAELKSNVDHIIRPMSFAANLNSEAAQNEPDLLLSLAIDERNEPVGLLDNDDEAEGGDDRDRTLKSAKAVDESMQEDEAVDLAGTSMSATMRPNPHHHHAMNSNNGASDQQQQQQAAVVSFGLPPTPQVPMGACFSTIFHGCPLRLHCSTRWIAPDSKDQHVLLGAEEGIYAINLNQLHESTLFLVHPRRCTWLYIVGDVLMAVQGK